MGGEYLEIKALIVPLSYMLSGLVLGLLFERIILSRLKRLSARTSWQGDDLIIQALKGFTTFWFFLLGLYLAVRLVEIPIEHLELIRNVISISFILSVTFVCARLAKGFLGLYMGSAENVPSTSMISNLLRIAVYVVGFLVALQRLGISITPIITALGVGGLAVALALQDTLSNLFAGMQILISRQVRPGDYVKLNTGEEGYVRDITLRNTTITQLSNNVIIVPNSKMANAIVVNYSLYDTETSLIIGVGVGYNSDLEKVEQITKDVAKEILSEIEGGIPEFEPGVRFHTFGDSSIQFNVSLRSKEFSNQFLLKSEFIKRLHKRYQQEDIEIPFPIRTVYLKKEE